MEGKIVQVKKGDKVYCYYKLSYRVKVDPTGTGKGKTKGTGKSKVINPYLHSAAGCIIISSFK